MKLAGPFAAPPPPKPKKQKRDTDSERAEKNYVRARDRGCVAHRSMRLAGIGGADVLSPCSGPLDVDHVRASGGLGIKSESHRLNLCVLCRHHHDAKTQYGKTWRPLLIAYINSIEPAARPEGHI